MHLPGRLGCEHFIDYGDAGQYRKRLEEVRSAFADLKTPQPPPGQTPLPPQPPK